MNNALTPAALESLWTAVDSAAADVAKANPTMRFDSAQMRAGRIVASMGPVVAARFGTKGRGESVRVVRDVLLGG